MAYFKDAQECDQILGNFFRKMSEGVAGKDPVLTEIQRKMAEMGLIVKFVWREPEMTLTLDFTKDPFAVYANDDTIEPTATFTLTADNGHKFWHGKINLAKALTTKTIVARGPIPKILKLLPVIEPLYKRYPAYLQEIGRADLVVS
ncbi:MAG: SCP2 sterol-binding domain-containing protein [Dehalococcoidia bacterium]|nr:SCP2 sterol-binding domain-containing protein [Dehalococcoidia bacterium]